MASILSLLRKKRDDEEEQAKREAKLLKSGPRSTQLPTGPQSREMPTVLDKLTGYQGPGRAAPVSGTGRTRPSLPGFVRDLGVSALNETDLTRSRLLAEGRTKAAQNAAAIVGARSALTLFPARPAAQLGAGFLQLGLQANMKDLPDLRPANPNILTDLFLTNSEGVFQNPLQRAAERTAPSLERSARGEISPIRAGANVLGVAGLAAAEVIPGVGGTARTGEKLGARLLERYGDDAVDYLRIIRSGDQRAIANLSTPIRNDILQTVRTLDKGGVNDLVRTVERGASSTPSVSRSLATRSLATRSLPDTIRASESTAPEIAGRISDQLYIRKSNVETLREGKEYLESFGSLDNAVSEIKRAGSNLTSQQVSAANIALDQLQSAGRWDDALDLIETTSRQATELGRAVQALSLFGRLTPTGALRYTNRLIDQAKELAGVASRRASTLKLSEDAAQQISRQAELVQTTLNKGGDTTREFAVESAKLLQLMRQQVPPTIGQQLSGYQTISLLSGPKTFLRNILGSVSVGGAEAISSVPARVLDRLASLGTGQRTTGATRASEFFSGARRGLQEGVQDVRLGIDTSQSAVNKFDVSRRFGPVFGQLDTAKNRVVGRTARPGLFQGARQAGLNTLSKAEEIVGYSVRVPDRAAFEGVYQAELEKLRRIAPDYIPDSTLVEEALLQAQRVTLQDPNGISESLGKLKRLANANKNFGFGDALLKFTQVPGALVKRSIEYSPLGILDTAMQMRTIQNKTLDPVVRSWLMQRRGVSGLSRVTVGSSAIAAGATLATAGIISSKKSDDPDIAALEQTRGVREYSINLDALTRYIAGGFDQNAAKPQEGDNLVNFDIFQPLAVPVAMGVDIAQNGGDSFFMNLAGVVAENMNTIFEQPVFTGIERFTKGIAYNENPLVAAIQTAASIPSTFIPSIVSTLRYVVDDKLRMTYDDNTWNTAVNLVLNRIPGLSQKLPERVDVLGEDQQLEGTTLGRIINPLFVEKYKAEGTAANVLDIIRESGETGAAPRVIQDTISIPGAGTLDLTNKQRSELQRVVGSTTKEVFDNLLANERFAALDAEKQAEFMSQAISDIYGDARYIPYVENLGVDLPDGLAPDQVANIIEGLRGTGDTKDGWDALDDETKAKIIERALTQ